MSLQARLRHPLGERWIELPPRGVDQPLVVGRAGGAEVQVPSATVGQRHCVLFVHEGHWVVQDVTPGGGGTFVNGAKVEGAAFLHVGDVITLGPGTAAPSIEIDPAGAAEGHSGQPATGIDPAAAAESELSVTSPHYAPPHAAPYVPPPVAPATYPAGYPVYPGGYPVPAPAAPAPWPQQPAPAAVPDGSIVDWPADATPRYHSPRRRRTSDGSSGVIIGMFLTLLITAGTGYWLYRQRSQPVQVVQPPDTTTQPAGVNARPRTGDDSGGGPPSIFESTNPRSAAATRTTTRPSTRSAAGTTTPGGGADDMTPPAPPPADPPMGTDASSVAAAPPDDAAPQDDTTAAPGAGDDPEWRQVEAARFLKDEAKAILQFEDYARTHPGAPADKLREYTDTMLDRIWLERVENLCEQREELDKKIRELDRETSEETDAAHKTRVLVPLRQKYVAMRQNIEEELTQNMKYPGKETPNLLDDAQVEKLRQARDPQYFTAWKTRVLAHIRRTHGELPWVATKTR